MFVVDNKQNSGRHVMGTAEWWGLWPTTSAKAPEKVGHTKDPFSTCDGGPFRVPLTSEDSPDTRREQRILSACDSGGFMVASSLTASALRISCDANQATVQPSLSDAKLRTSPNWVYTGRARSVRITWRSGNRDCLSAFTQVILPKVFPSGAIERYLISTLRKISPKAAAKVKSWEHLGRHKDQQKTLTPTFSSFPFSSAVSRQLLYCVLAANNFATNKPGLQSTLISSKPCAESQTSP